MLQCLLQPALAFPQHSHSKSRFDETTLFSHARWMEGQRGAVDTGSGAVFTFLWDDVLFGLGEKEQLASLHHTPQVAV